MKGISILLSLVALPISMYIQYSLLQAIHADRLLMFLFWANMPIIFLVHVISELAKKDGK